MKNKWSLFNQGNLFIFSQREFSFIRLLKHYEIFDLRNKKILDLGCGSGFELYNMLKFGALPKNLYGIDIRAEAIFQAKKKNPHINFLIANASFLPFKDLSFDIEIQYTLFSSVIDKKDRINIVKEMLRVIKREGLIIWYDFFINPLNKETKAIGKKEIKQLFKGCKLYFKRITLAPLISRKLGEFSILLCLFLEKIKIFNTHYLIGIKKNGQ